MADFVLEWTLGSVTAIGAQNQNLEVCNHSVSDTNELRNFIKPMKR